MKLQVNIPTRPARRFLPDNFEVTTWENLKPYFDDLLARNPQNSDEFVDWLKDMSEVSAVLEEDAAWRYIHMTCDTENKEKAERFQYFVTQIQPQIAPFSNELDKKTLASPFLEEVKNKPGFGIMIKQLEKDVAIFREENIAVIAEIQAEQQKFGAISGAMTVEIDGKELTLQQAGVLLENPDRQIRENAWKKIAERRIADKDKLDTLFDTLVEKRNKVAQNAGFVNYRDYSFKASGRFDYTPEDCFHFHDAIAKELVPVLNELSALRKQVMQVDTLRPWDKKADKLGKPPIKAFTSSDELIEKSIEALYGLNPFFGECIAIMREMKHLDLESRKGKAPGGYNYPLYETNVPFVFMNGTGTIRDLVTMMHEAGHAIHSILNKDLELTSFKSITPEIAELASMSMELMSMDYWHLFIPDTDELRRAKLDHLEDIIGTLPWVATVDSFQHWVYENPTSGIEARHDAWLQIFNRFSDSVTSWEGLTEYKRTMWHRQMHIFEIPFYYIEYGIAQLGAIAVWKNYRTNPAQTTEQYKAALKLGYTKSIGEMYATAGIKFDFSREYINELMQFLRSEIKKIAES
jgi:oligoendopeptidase F